MNSNLTNPELTRLLSAGEFYYQEPTEDAILKREILEHKLSQFDSCRVLTTVGVDWPQFYINLGAAKVHVCDFNPVQISKFKESRTSNTLFDFHLMDLTQKSASLESLIKDSNLVDISNILDFVESETADRVLEYYLQSLNSGALLILSTSSGLFAQKIAKKFSRLRQKEFVCEKYFSNKGLIVSNFVILSKVS